MASTKVIKTEQLLKLFVASVRRKRRLTITRRSVPCANHLSGSSTLAGNDWSRCCGGSLSWEMLITRVLL